VSTAIDKRHLARPCRNVLHSTARKYRLFAAILSSNWKEVFMSTVDLRLVRLGQGQPRAGLVEQGTVSAGLAQEFATLIKPCGWTDQKTKQLLALVADLQTTQAVQADQRDDASTAHDGEADAKASAKAFVRKLRLAWPLALRDAGPNPGVAANAIESGGPIGQSTPKLVSYLTTVAPAVKTLDKQLAAYFGGQSPSATIAKLRPALEQADQKQENELAQVPAATQRIYEAKGRLLESITELNRIGQIAFDGDAGSRARFNKDILLRARHKRAVGVGTPAA
jgi:hypothetical protein